MAEFFNKNLKHIRKLRGLSQEDIANKINVDRSSISRWENNEMEITLENAIQIANVLNVSIPEFLGKDLTIDNAELIEIPSLIKIPLYGTITAGIPIEAQTDIIDYIEIPKSWVKDGKKFYGLKIIGNSMSPTYNDKDIVVFENVNYYDEANNKDCAVMVNGTECTFKKVFINDNGITLQPYNTTDFQPSMYTREQAESLPIRIVGIAVRRITDII